MRLFKQRNKILDKFMLLFYIISILHFSLQIKYRLKLKVLSKIGMNNFNNLSD